MEDQPDPLEGFFQGVRTFVKEIVDEEQPASAIVLEALRFTQPQLAKRVFIESVIQPTRDLLRSIGADGAADQVLEELESRFLQEPIVQILHEAQMLAGARLAWATWLRLEKWELEHSGIPLRDAQGHYTQQAWVHIRWVTHDVTYALGRLAGVREHRVQILLASVVAGTDAVERAVAEFVGYKHDALLQSLQEQLLCSINGKRLEYVMRQLAEYGTDEQIAELHKQFAGTAFVPRKTVDRIVFEILNRRQEIEF